MKKIKTAVVGCGSISDIYMTNLTTGKFTVMELVACSDLMVERMNASAAKFGIKAMSLDEICADPEIEMVICLTTPAAHYPIIKQALLAGKHVFSEKMIAVDLWQGKELVQIANEKGLHLGVAPDTFLGASVQTAKYIVDKGLIGKPRVPLPRLRHLRRVPDASGQEGRRHRLRHGRVLSDGAGCHPRPG